MEATAPRRKDEALRELDILSAILAIGSKELRPLKPVTSSALRSDGQYDGIAAGNLAHGWLACGDGNRVRRNEVEHQPEGRRRAG